jgi:hypothetical protein
MAIHTTHFKDLSSFFAAVGKAASPQDVHALKLIMTLPAPRPVQSVEDTLAAGRQAIEDNQSMATQSKIPAYFAALQSWLDPMKAEMERNAADALTPTNHEQDPMAAARDLCR